MPDEQEQTHASLSSLRVLVCTDPAWDVDLVAAATELATDLNLSLLDETNQHQADAHLVVLKERLELRMIVGDPQTRGGRPLFADLTKLDVTSPMGGRTRQPIGKAIGLHNAKDVRPTVIDCTAGWGEDSWLLAGIGCRVLAVERNPIIVALLRDGLSRASSQHEDVAARISLIQANAIDLLRRLTSPDATQTWLEAHRGALPADIVTLVVPDVVYLDPMFPPRRKGAEGKPLKVIRQLVGGDEDAGDLLEAALQVARRRVVVKRPIHSDPVGGQSPATCHKGKSVRYDIYPTG